MRALMIAVLFTAGLLGLPAPCACAESEALRRPTSQAGEASTAPEDSDRGAWLEQQSRIEKAHFDKAVAHWFQGRYEDAISEYEKAYRATRSPAHIYNIARGYSRLNRHREAADYYRRFLDETKPGPDLEVHLDYTDHRLSAAKYLDEELAQVPPPLHKRKWFRGVTIAGAILTGAAVVSVSSYYSTRPSAPEQVRFP